MRVGGMTVVERVVRDAAKRGVTDAVIRAAPEGFPDLSSAPIAIDRIDTTAGAPDLPRLDGRTIAGVEISDEDSRRRASRALLQSLRRPHDGLGDRHVIRPISLRLTGALAAIGVTPNAVTALNILVGIAACVAAFGTHLIAAGVLISRIDSRPAAPCAGRCVRSAAATSTCSRGARSESPMLHSSRSRSGCASGSPISGSPQRTSSRSRCAPSRRGAAARAPRRSETEPSRERPAAGGRPPRRG